MILRPKDWLTRLGRFLLGAELVILEKRCKDDQTLISDLLRALERERAQPWSAAKFQAMLEEKDRVITELRGQVCQCKEPTAIVQPVKKTWFRKKTLF